MFEVMLALGIRTGVIYRVSVDDGEVTPSPVSSPMAS